MNTQVDAVNRISMHDLTAQAVGGQPAAIDSLLRQIRPMVLRYCRARLGRISGHHHVADDVAQEVCIALVSALPRYRDMGRPFASFVYGIASHKVADAMRSAANLAIPTEDLPDEADDRPGPEETAVAYLEAERVRALLRRLPAAAARAAGPAGARRPVRAGDRQRARHVRGRRPGRPAPRPGPAAGHRRRGVHRLTPRGLPVPPWQRAQSAGLAQACVPRRGLGEPLAVAGVADRTWPYWTARLLG